MRQRSKPFKAVVGSALALVLVAFGVGVGVLVHRWLYDDSEREDYRQGILDAVASAEERFAQARGDLYSVLEVAAEIGRGPDDYVVAYADDSFDYLLIYHEPEPPGTVAGAFANHHQSSVCAALEWDAAGGAYGLDEVPQSMCDSGSGLAELPDLLRSSADDLTGDRPSLTRQRAAMRGVHIESVESSPGEDSTVLTVSARIDLPADVDRESTICVLATVRVTEDSTTGVPGALLDAQFCDR